VVRISALGSYPAASKVPTVCNKKMTEAHHKNTSKGKKTIYIYNQKIVSNSSSSCSFATRIKTEMGSKYVNNALAECFQCIWRAHYQVESILHKQRGILKK
jgi:hypothetical protein